MLRGARPAAEAARGTRVMSSMLTSPTSTRLEPPPLEPFDGFRTGEFAGEEIGESIAEPRLEEEEVERGVDDASGSTSQLVGPCGSPGKRGEGFIHTGLFDGRLTDWLADWLVCWQICYLDSGFCLLGWVHKEVKS